VEKTQLSRLLLLKKHHHQFAQRAAHATKPTQGCEGSARGQEAVLEVSRHQESEIAPRLLPWSALPRALPGHRAPGTWRSPVGQDMATRAKGWLKDSVSARGGGGSGRVGFGGGLRLRQTGRSPATYIGVHSFDCFQHARARYMSMRVFSDRANLVKSWCALRHAGVSAGLQGGAQ
jgi:hypothetical protein